MYKEIFNKEPVLSKDEKPVYVEFDQTIPDFRKKLPDILYTLKNLKFKNNPDFDPSINWLLSENHLAKLLNGEYGKLQSWQAEKDRLKQQAEYNKRIKASEDVAESKIRQEEEIIANCDSKIKAIDLIVAKSQESGVEIFQNFKKIHPRYKDLMKKFDITVKELKEWREKHYA